MGKGIFTFLSVHLPKRREATGVVCLQNTCWPHIRYQEGAFLRKTCGSSTYISQDSVEKNWEDVYI